MGDVKHSLVVRLISSVLIVSFLTMDVAWAYPPENAPVSSTLAVPSVSQTNPVTDSAREVLLEAGFRGSIASIGKILFYEDPYLSHLAEPLEYQLGPAGEQIVFQEVQAVVVREAGDTAPLRRDDMVTDDAIIIIPYKKRDGSVAHIALAKKNNPVMNELPGSGELIGDFIVKEYTDMSAVRARELAAARAEYRYVGVSMGGNKLAVSLNDGNNKIIGGPVELRWDSDPRFAGGKIRDASRADEVVDVLAGMIARLAEESGTPPNSIMKVSAGLAGPVDKISGIFGSDFKTPNLPFDKYPFSRMLSARLAGLGMQVGVEIMNDGESSLKGEHFSPQGGLAGIPGGIVINGGGVNITVDDGSILECGHNLYRAPGDDGEVHYVWVGDKTGGKHPIERGNTPEEIVRVSGDIGREYVGLGEEEFLKKYPGYPMIDWSAGMRDFENMLSGPAIRQRVRNSIDRAKSERSPEAGEYLAIEEAAKRQSRPDELERAVTPEALSGNMAATALIREFAADMGMALAAFTAAYHDRDFSRHLVLVSGINENMGKGLYENDDDRAKDLDIYIKYIRLSMRDELVNHFNIGESEARDIASGVVRSKMTYERELVSYQPIDEEVLAAYRSSLGSQGRVQQGRGIEAVTPEPIPDSQDAVNPEDTPPPATSVLLVSALRWIAKKFAGTEVLRWAPHLGLPRMAGSASTMTDQHMRSGLIRYSINVAPWIEEALRFAAYITVFAAFTHIFGQPLHLAMSAATAASFMLFIAGHASVYVVSPRNDNILERRGLFYHTRGFRQWFFFAVPGLLLSAIAPAYPVTVFIHREYNKFVGYKGGIFAMMAKAVTLGDRIRQFQRAIPGVSENYIKMLAEISTDPEDYVSGLSVQHRMDIASKFVSDASPATINLSLAEASSIVFGIRSGHDREITRDRYVLNFAGRTLVIEPQLKSAEASAKIYITAASMPTGLFILPPAMAGSEISAVKMSEEDLIMANALYYDSAVSRAIKRIEGVLREGAVPKDADIDALCRDIVDAINVHSQANEANMGSLKGMFADDYGMDISTVEKLFNIFYGQYLVHRIPARRAFDEYYRKLRSLPSPGIKEALRINMEKGIEGLPAYYPKTRLAFQKSLEMLEEGAFTSYEDWREHKVDLIAKAVDEDRDAIKSEMKSKMMRVSSARRSATVDSEWVARQNAQIKATGVKGLTSCQLVEMAMALADEESAGAEEPDAGYSTKFIGDIAAQNVIRHFNGLVDNYRNYILATVEEIDNLICDQPVEPEGIYAALDGLVADMDRIGLVSGDCLDIKSEVERGGYRSINGVGKIVYENIIVPDDMRYIQSLVDSFVEAGGIGKKEASDILKRIWIFGSSLFCGALAAEAVRNAREVYGRADSALSDRMEAARSLATAGAAMSGMLSDIMVTGGMLMSQSEVYSPSGRLRDARVMSVTAKGEPKPLLWGYADIQSVNGLHGAKADFAASGFDDWLCWIVQRGGDSRVIVPEKTVNIALPSHMDEDCLTEDICAKDAPPCDRVFMTGYVMNTRYPTLQMFNDYYELLGSVALPDPDKDYPGVPVSMLIFHQNSEGVYIPHAYSIRNGISIEKLRQSLISAFRRYRNTETLRSFSFMKNDKGEIESIDVADAARLFHELAGRVIARIYPEDTDRQEAVLIEYMKNLRRMMDDLLNGPGIKDDVTGEIQSYCALADNAFEITMSKAIAEEELLNAGVIVEVPVNLNGPYGPYRTFATINENDIFPTERGHIMTLREATEENGLDPDTMETLFRLFRRWRHPRLNHILGLIFALCDRNVISKSRAMELAEKIGSDPSMDDTVTQYKLYRPEAGEFLYSDVAFSALILGTAGPVGSRFELLRFINRMGATDGDNRDKCSVDNAANVTDYGEARVLMELAWSGDIFPDSGSHDRFWKGFAEDLSREEGISIEVPRFHGSVALPKTIYDPDGEEPDALRLDRDNILILFRKHLLRVRGLDDVRIAEGLMEPDELHIVAEARIDSRLGRTGRSPEKKQSKGGAGKKGKNKKGVQQTGAAGKEGEKAPEIPDTEKERLIAEEMTAMNTAAREKVASQPELTLLWYISDQLGELAEGDLRRKKLDNLFSIITGREPLRIRLDAGSFDSEAKRIRSARRAGEAAALQQRVDEARTALREVIDTGIKGTNSLQALDSLASGMKDNISMVSGEMEELDGYGEVKLYPEVAEEFIAGLAAQRTLIIRRSRIADREKADAMVAAIEDEVKTANDVKTLDALEAKGSVYSRNASRSIFRDLESRLAERRKAVEKDRRMAADIKVRRALVKVYLCWDPAELDRLEKSVEGELDSVDPSTGTLQAWTNGINSQRARAEAGASSLVDRAGEILRALEGRFDECATAYEYNSLMDSIAPDLASADAKTRERLSNKAMTAKKRVLETEKNIRMKISSLDGTMASDFMSINLADHEKILAAADRQLAERGIRIVDGNKDEWRKKVGGVRALSQFRQPVDILAADRAKADGELYAMAGRLTEASLASVFEGDRGSANLAVYMRASDQARRAFEKRCGEIYAAGKLRLIADGAKELKYSADNEREISVYRDIAGSSDISEAAAAVRSARDQLSRIEAGKFFDVSRVARFGSAKEIASVAASVDIYRPFVDEAVADGFKTALEKRRQELFGAVNDGLRDKPSAEKTGELLSMVLDGEYADMLDDKEILGAVHRLAGLFFQNEAGASAEDFVAMLADIYCIAELDRDDLNRSADRGQEGDGEEPIDSRRMLQSIYDEAAPSLTLDQKSNALTLFQAREAVHLVYQLGYRIGFEGNLAWMLDFALLTESLVQESGMAQDEASLANEILSAVASLEENGVLVSGLSWDRFDELVAMMGLSDEETEKYGATYPFVIEDEEGARSIHFNLEYYLSGNNGIEEISSRVLEEAGINDGSVVKLDRILPNVRPAPAVEALEEAPEVAETPEAAVAAVAEPEAEAGMPSPPEGPVASDLPEVPQETTPVETTDVRGLLILASEAFKAGDYEGTIRYAGEVLGIYGNNITANLLMAKAGLKRGDLDAAVQFAQKTVVLCEENRDPGKWVSSKFDAVTVILESSNVISNDVSPDISRAESLIEYVIEKDPRSISAHLVYSEILLKKGDTVKALDEARTAGKLTEADPNRFIAKRFNIMVQTALIYETMGDHNKARTWIARAETVASECRRLGRRVSEDRLRVVRDRVNTSLAATSVSIWDDDDIADGSPKPMGRSAENGAANDYRKIARGFLNNRYGDIGFYPYEGLETGVWARTENRINTESGDLTRLINRAMEALNGLILPDIELGGYWETICNLPDNKGPPISIKVSSSLRSMSARYAVTDDDGLIREVQIILNAKMVEDLVNNYRPDEIGEIGVYILAERLFHELGHTNTEGSREKEDGEEHGLIDKDARLHELIRSTELRGTASEPHPFEGRILQQWIHDYFELFRPKWPSGYYFDFLYKLIGLGVGSDEYHFEIDRYIGETRLPGHGAAAPKFMAPGHRSGDMKAGMDHRLSDLVGIEDYSWISLGNDAHLRLGILDMVSKELRRDRPLGGDDAVRAARRIIDAIYGVKTSKNIAYGRDHQHAVMVAEWAAKMRPADNAALVIAALAHDIDRAFEDIRVKKRPEEGNAFLRPTKLIDHPAASARLIALYLRAANLDASIIDEVTELIRYHEAGVDGYGEGLPPMSPDNRLYHQVIELSSADSMAEFFLTLDTSLASGGAERFIEEMAYKYSRIHRQSDRDEVDTFVEEDWLARQGRDDIAELFNVARDRAGNVNGAASDNTSGHVGAAISHDIANAVIAEKPRYSVMLNGRLQAAAGLTASENAILKELEASLSASFKDNVVTLPALDGLSVDLGQALRGEYALSDAENTGINTVEIVLVDTGNDFLASRINEDGSVSVQFAHAGRGPDHGNNKMYVYLPRAILAGCQDNVQLMAAQIAEEMVEEIARRNIEIRGPPDAEAQKKILNDVHDHLTGPALADLGIDGLYARYGMIAANLQDMSHEAAADVPAIRIGRVLVVDDEIHHRTLGKLCVQSYAGSIGQTRDSIEVVTAGNSIEALEALTNAKEPFDLALIDYNLTESQSVGVDGDKLVADIRRASLKKQPVIVLWTVNTMADEPTSLISSGVIDAYGDKNRVLIPPRFPGFINEVLERIARRDNIRQSPAVGPDQAVVQRSDTEEQYMTALPLVSAALLNEGQRAAAARSLRSWFDHPDINVTHKRSVERYISYLRIGRHDRLKEIYLLFSEDGKDVEGYVDLGVEITDHSKYAVMEIAPWNRVLSDGRGRAPRRYAGVGAELRSLGIRKMIEVNGDSILDRPNILRVLTLGNRSPGFENVFNDESAREDVFRYLDEQDEKRDQFLSRYDYRQPVVTTAAEIPGVVPSFVEYETDPDFEDYKARLANFSEAEVVWISWPEDLDLMGRQGIGDAMSFIPLLPFALLRSAGPRLRKIVVVTNYPELVNGIDERLIGIRPESFDPAIFAEERPDLILEHTNFFEERLSGVDGYEDVVNMPFLCFRLMEDRADGDRYLTIPERAYVNTKRLMEGALGDRADVPAENAPFLARRTPSDRPVFVNPHAVTNLESFDGLLGSWAEVIAGLLRDGRKVMLNSGQDADRENTERLVAELNSLVSGDPALKARMNADFEVISFGSRSELIDFISRAGSVITIDTGVFHIAHRIFGVPSVVVTTINSGGWISPSEDGFRSLEDEVFRIEPRISLSLLESVEDESARRDRSALFSRIVSEAERLPVNSRMREMENMAAKVMVDLVASGSALDMPEYPARLSRLTTSARIARINSIVEAAGYQGASGMQDVIDAVDKLKDGMDQFEADGLIASIIIKARRAGDEGQDLIVGIETDWVPDMEDTSYGHQGHAINRLINDIESLSEKFNRLNLKNVKIVHRKSADLATAIVDEAGRSRTQMRNVVILASQDTLETSAFEGMTGDDVVDRPFVACIDPSVVKRMHADYSEKGMMPEIEIVGLIGLAIDLSIGKEPVDTSNILSYDKDRRRAILKPEPKLKDLEALRVTYEAKRQALEAA